MLRLWVVLLLCPAVCVLGLLQPTVLRHARHQRQGQRNQLVLMSSSDGPALPLKSVAAGTLLIVGVFGTGFLDTIQRGIREAGAPPAQQQQSLKKASVEGEQRGAMTRLTRREINFKLAQVPVFFAANGDAVYLDGQRGQLFINVEDAEAYAKSKGGLPVKAATLEDVYFPLVVKKAKISTFLPGVAVASDPAAEYVLVPPAKQTKTMTDAAVAVDANDVPLFRVPNLAFSKGSLEIPLFLYREDAQGAYERLKDDKAKEGKPAPPELVIQVTSINKIISLWEAGGFEGRALELYPGTNDIDNARVLLGDKDV